VLKDTYKMHNIEIESNYGDRWDYTVSQDQDFILIKDTNHNESLGINIAQAKFIRDSLNEIITYYESIPKIGNKVLVVNGMFQGYYGVIMDIDSCDSKKPLAIKLNDNSTFNNCTCFVNFDDVNNA